MLNISVTEFESHLNQILNRVEAGDEVTITR
ncbi:Prevent-host-death protein, partial [Candidatus Thiomargarita nelsonii]